MSGMSDKKHKVTFFSISDKGSIIQEKNDFGDKDCPVCNDHK